MNRRAPESGYDFAQKRNYRRCVWAVFARELSTRRATAQALLMPSAEGDEIDVALSKGFRERNLHIVDSNPAIVANLKRRYPSVNTYGVSLAKAIGRIEDAGTKLSCANIDLCNCIGTPMMLEVAQAFAGDVWDHAGAVVAITVLRGRERSEYFTACQELGAGDTDAGRVEFMRSLVSRQFIESLLETPEKDWILNTVTKLRSEIYRSGRQTMLWSAFRIISALGRLEAEIRDLKGRPAVIDRLVRSAIDNVSKEPMVRRFIARDDRSRFTEACRHTIAALFNGEITLDESVTTRFLSAQLAAHYGE